MLPHDFNQRAPRGSILCAILAGGAQKGHSAGDSKGGTPLPAHGGPQTVNASTLLRRLAGVVIAVITVTLPATLVAQATTQTGSQLPTPQELARVSSSGSYLAARHAGVQRDASAAATYYRAALRADPRNSELLERAFLSVLTEGDIDEAVRLADRVIHVDRNDRDARLVLGLRALKHQQFGTARQNLASRCAGRSPT